MHVARRTSCRACGSKSLTKVVDLGEQHLQGSFLRPGKQSPLRRVPMTLVRCNPLEDEHACGLLQAEHTVPPEMMYQSYWYRSGTNSTMRDHLRMVAEDAIAQLGRDPKYVLDIGCNDGTLLNWFDTGEVEGLWGVDPSNITTELKQRTGKEVTGGVTIINDFFPSLAADAEIGNVRFDIITSIAMFYDLPNPVAFARRVDSLLTKEGVFVFEMSHMPAMLRQNAYDTVCHEHLEYYSLATIEEICGRAGLKVTSVSENSINGGSIRCTAVKAENDRRPDDSVLAVRSAEFDMRLESDQPYTLFQQRAEVHRDELMKLLRRLKEEGKKIHVYGASTKGNTLLQWCQVDTRLIDAAADRNKDKWGTKTPGTEIPIISEEASRSMRPDYYLVLPWHFKEEFVERERAQLARGTRFIFPLPKIEIIG